MPLGVDELKIKLQRDRSILSTSESSAVNSDLSSVLQNVENPSQE